MTINYIVVLDKEPTLDYMDLKPEDFPQPFQDLTPAVTLVGEVELHGGKARVMSRNQFSVGLLLQLVEKK